MIPDIEKTPPIVTFDPGVSRSPRFTPLPRKTPPPGRPSGAFSITEMTEAITLEVSRRVAVEIDRGERALRAELTAEIKTVTALAITSLAMNALLGLLVLAFARMLPGRVVGVALAGLTIFTIGVATSLKRQRRQTQQTIEGRPIASA
jgi:hypothetical protein